MITEQAVRHRRAFDVPAGTAVAERGRPARFPGFGRFPQYEIERVALVFVHLDADYTHTIVARKRRDYVWIMARTPSIDASLYARLVGEVEALGYDSAELRRVPQRW